MSKILIGILLFFSLFAIKGSPDEYRAHVLSVDNSSVTIAGTAKLGDQKLQIKCLNGKYKNKVFTTYNALSGSLEYDEFYKKDDTILIAIKEKGNHILVKPLALYRLPALLILVGIFILALIVYAGKTGINSILSFFISIFIIWEFFIPQLYTGKHIFLSTILTLTILSAIIIFLVAGFTKKSLAAFLGTSCGLFITVIFTEFTGHFFHLDGMNQSFSQALMFSRGFSPKHILIIFYSAIGLGASGAAMDIAMDMAASIAEVYLTDPNISKKQLIKSGFNVGKVVIGTMTTTLLLAYSGSYLTLLLLFLDRDISLMNLLNLKIVMAEIFKILIGSIGLIIVAPSTIFISVYIYTSKRFSKLKLTN